MFDATKWLNEPVKWRDFGGNAQTGPRHERLCFLITANGGVNFKGWGFIGSGPHQQGLEQNDALELLEYGGFIAGLTAAGVNLQPAFEPLLNAYRARYFRAGESANERA